MTKTLKISLIIIGLLLALAILAVVFIGSLVNTGAFKERLTQQVLDQTGQTLIIEGDLSFSVFPWLGFKAGKITLSQPADIQSQNLLEISAVDIGVKLLPLLQKKIEAGHIELKQPKLYYVVTDEGKTSLDALIQKPATSKPDADRQTEQSKQALFSTIAITGIKITDGQIVYDNQKEKTLYTINDLTIETGNLLSKHAVPFSISSQITSNTAALVSFQTEGKARFDIENKSLTLKEIDLSISEKTHSLSSTINAILFDSNKKMLSINDILIDSHFDNLKPQFLMPSIDINFKENTSSKAAFSISEASTNIQLSGKLLAKDWHKNPMIKGHIESNTIKPLDLAKQFGITYTPTDASVLKSLSFISRFSGTPKGFSLHSVKTTLDNTTITGDGSIINFEKPHYRFDLNIDAINVDQYLPKTETKENSTNAGLAIAAPIPVFRGISATGMVRIEKIQASGAKLSKLIVDIKSSNNQVKIKPKAQLYGGRTTGTITFTDNEQQPSINITNQLTNVDIEPLLNDTGISDQVSGRATIQMDITALEKNNQQENKGVINIAIKEGALKGIDIKKILDDTQEKLDEFRGKAVETRTSNHNDKTRFADMTATLHLKNNVITNKDLKVKAPAFRVSGKGKIELEPQKIDYLSDITIVNTNEGQGGKERSDLKGAVIPVHFFGDISAPEYKVDTRALIKKNTEKAVDKKKEELKEKLKEKILEELFK